MARRGERLRGRQQQQQQEQRQVEAAPSTEETQRLLTVGSLSMNATCPAVNSCCGTQTMEGV
jgi:hypothetical protein